MLRNFIDVFHHLYWIFENIGVYILHKIILDSPLFSANGNAVSFIYIAYLDRFITKVGPFNSKASAYFLQLAVNIRYNFLKSSQKSTKQQAQDITTLRFFCILL